MRGGPETQDNPFIAPYARSPSRLPEPCHPRLSIPLFCLEHSLEIETESLLVPVPITFHFKSGGRKNLRVVACTHKVRWKLHGWGLCWEGGPIGRGGSSQGVLFGIGGSSLSARRWVLVSVFFLGGRALGGRLSRGGSFGGGPLRVLFHGGHLLRAAHRGALFQEMLFSEARFGGHFLVHALWRTFAGRQLGKRCVGGTPHEGLGR